jgi:hypothetical protein
LAAYIASSAALMIWRESNAVPLAPHARVDGLAVVAADPAQNDDQASHLHPFREMSAVRNAN